MPASIGLTRRCSQPDAISNAIGYTRFYSRSHDAVIRVYDEAGNVIATHEQAGQFKELGECTPVKQRAAMQERRDGSFRKLRLLRLVDRFSDYSGRFAVPVC
jgi:hypothetical protein